MADDSALRPIEIARSGKHDVLIKWNDGHETVFPAQFLRLSCPCAACVEEMTGVRILRAESVPADVHPIAIHPVGRYAIQIQWSDGHGSGIYTWERLAELSRQLEARA